jgi:hypothetical protein
MIDCAFNVSEKTIYFGFNKFEKYQILFMLLEPRLPAFQLMGKLLDASITLLLHPLA